MKSKSKASRPQVPGRRRPSGKVSPGTWPSLDRTAVSAFSSFAEADRADREAWWARTPLERLRALELVRQVAYGYGPGKPVPRFQRVLEVDELR